MDSMELFASGQGLFSWLDILDAFWVLDADDELSDYF